MTETAQACTFHYAIWKLSRGGLRQHWIQIGTIDVPTDDLGFVAPGSVREAGQKIYDRSTGLFGRVELTIFQSFFDVEEWLDSENWDALYRYRVSEQFYPEGKIPGWPSAKLAAEWDAAYEEDC
ncbi:hypothetical protein [Frankia sp. AgW1.1]|uniref:hypothetical protein n=1 Tax=Frankia sp. AgW1.1 TaxID=1836971 RepID=UPI0019340E7C|nr:hypothetical protein [Frankia sp. AgW1.1]MBL7487063.1 hypothetical protein [Frankia sp. AgW1.1]